MAEYFDTLETRPHELREEQLFAGLRGQLVHARRNAPHFGRSLPDMPMRDRSDLAALPVLRKSDLIEIQRAEPPFGGLAAAPMAQLGRIFQSPGPIYDPEGRGSDYWRMARALHAAGFRSGDLVHNCFSYHFTPAGAIFESGALALGCPVFPGGVGQTELQCRAIADLKPAGYVGTPSFLKIILDKGREIGADLSSLSKALVSGEALPPALRQDLRDQGVDACQCYATADLGLIAYESRARDGLIVDEGVIVEIVRPGTGIPVPAGEVGEVVVTTLAPEYPLIRFATGDLSALLPGKSPCGRTNLRLKGWMGRADQTTKVKGMFVHPQQVAEVLKRHPAVIRARLVVGRDADNDTMELRCEVAQGGGEDLRRGLGESLQAILKLRGQVAFAAPGSLPNDGKVIEDTRGHG